MELKVIKGKRLGKIKYREGQAEWMAEWCRNGGSCWLLAGWQLDRVYTFLMHWDDVYPSWQASQELTWYLENSRRSWTSEIANGHTLSEKLKIGTDIAMIVGGVE